MAAECPEDLAKAKGGDQEAAGRVLAAHRGLIVQWCNQMVMSGFDLDDMIQEANIAGLDAIKWYDRDRGFEFSTYLKQCVRNRLGKWRSDRRQIPLPQEGADEGLDLVADVEAVDQEWLAGEMEKLTPMERQVLELKFGLAGGGALETDEIGRRLGMGAQRVELIELEARSKLRRAAPEEN